MKALREIEEEKGRIGPEEHRRSDDRPRLSSWKQKKFKAEILEKGRREVEVPFALAVRKKAGHKFAEAGGWAELQQTSGAWPSGAAERRRRHRDRRGARA